jgi:hypothetical protein
MMSPAHVENITMGRARGEPPTHPSLDFPVPTPVSSHPGQNASRLLRSPFAGSATRRTEGLTWGDFFGSIGAFLKNLRFCL